jgi:hypothetical protein
VGERRLTGSSGPSKRQPPGDPYDFFTEHARGPVPLFEVDDVPDGNLYEFASRGVPGSPPMVPSMTIGTDIRGAGPGGGRPVCLRRPAGSEAR